MKFLKSVIQHLKSWHQPRCWARHTAVPLLDRHTLKDIGVDPMALELQRNERLWQELAS
ncbi:hypothetical protein [Marinobacterium aestuarii]|uniref:hypothetical protein n=1 Tax=Marinobacterium aestuarii TaxID=1821621 RepID=UPI000B2735ED|nr:hypothetical protein [Marinobacterium aestuarii]